MHQLESIDINTILPDNLRIKIMHISKISQLLQFGIHTLPINEANLNEYNYTFLNYYLTNNELTIFLNFKTIKRQLEWLCGRISIKQLVADEYNCTVNSVQINRYVSGAPYIQNKESTKISISHCSDYAIGLINFHANKPVGIDIERINKSVSDDFLKVAFSKKELSSFKNINEVFKNWTVKEAYLKYIETGFNYTLTAIEYIDNTIYCNNQPVSDIHIVSAPFSNHYYFSIIY